MKIEPEVENTNEVEKIPEIRKTENIKRSSHTILPHFEMIHYYPEMKLIIKKKDPNNGEDIEKSYNICNYFLLSVAIVVVVVILATVL